MRTSLEIQNLKCGGCGNTITNRLSTLEDVNAVSVDTEDSIVSFDHTKDSTFESVRQALAKLGYPAIDETNSLGRKAKSYISCAMGKIGS